MGVYDIVTREYTANPEVFADAFNFLLYDGKQIIKPEQLHEMDTVALATLYGKGDLTWDASKGSSVQGIQKYRDSLKSLAMMEDEENTYLILGIESQSQQHFAMPVRNLLYDALQYAGQVRDTAKAHRRERKHIEPTGNTPQTYGGVSVRAKMKKQMVSSEEFLSGFYKEDRLTPVITLVILFDMESWEEPMSLHEMFHVKDRKILRYVPDYSINLMAPAAMSDEEINHSH